MRYNEHTLAAPREWASHRLGVGPAVDPSFEVQVHDLQPQHWALALGGEEESQVGPARRVVRPGRIADENHLDPAMQGFRGGAPEGEGGDHLVSRVGQERQ